MGQAYTLYISWNRRCSCMPEDPAPPESGGWRQPFRYRLEAGMQLGASSVSLAVKGLEASRAFYEKFGFRAFAGNASQNWLILKNRRE